MAIFQLQAKDSLARIGNYDALNSLQSLSWDSAMNAENLNQLGDANYDAQIIQPEVSGSFEVRSTGSTAAFLSRMIYKLNAGTGEFEGYLAGTNQGGTNAQLVRETDLQFAVFDLIEAKRANEVFDRAVLLPRAILSQLQISASSEGNATETYSFEADLLEVYRKPHHDLISLACVRDTAGTPATTAVLPSDAFRVETYTVDAAAAYKVVVVDVDGVRIPASMLDVTVGGVGVADKITLTAAAQTAGYSFPLGARISLLAYKKTPGSYPTITYPTAARFIKADQINLWLISPAATFDVGGNVRTVEAHLAAGVNFNDIPFSEDDLWLRVQSIDFSVNLNREALREIKKNDRGNSIYFRTVQFPLDIGVSISTLETELKEWARIQGKDLLGADASPDVLNLADFENKEWMVIRRDYHADAAIQTVGILNARVDGYGSQVSVGGRAEVSYNMTGSKLAIQGVAA